MKYIDADKLYEYLEQVGKCYPRYADNIVDNAVSNVIDGIKTFVASLQQEQPSEDLEEGIVHYPSYKKGYFDGREDEKEQMMKDYDWLIPVSSNIEPKADIVHTTNSAPIDDGKAMLHVADKSYKIGWRDCKHEMLKEAVETTMVEGSLSNPIFVKRKVIIVKEDEK